MFIAFLIFLFIYPPIAFLILIIGLAKKILSKN